jgi:acyl dehydratase
MTLVLDGPDGLRSALGADLGTSPWVTVTADRIRTFGEATDDPAATYLSLSLTNHFLPMIVEVRGFTMGVNYGTGVVRHGKSLRDGDRVRAGATLVAVEEIRGGLQTVMMVTVSVEGRDEPACTVEAISRWFT